VPAVVSFLHRVSGTLLFLAGLPLLLWVLDTSLATPQGYERVAALFAAPLMKLVLLALVWAYLHHLIAGVRHLFGDLDIGLDLAPARRSAALVLVLGIVLALAVGARLW
jgi:succinate dehydrogenase / fumarate reductase cytochrome b subunit